MTIHEMRKLVESLSGSYENYRKLSEVLSLLEDDLKFGMFSHDNYLPIAKEYREYLKSHNGTNYGALPQFQRLRGRLGASSRRMYAMQSKTFEKSINLLLSEVNLDKFISKEMIHSWWLIFKRVEKKWLSEGRSRA